MYGHANNWGIGNIKQISLEHMVEKKWVLETFLLNFVSFSSAEFGFPPTLWVAFFVIINDIWKSYAILTR